MVGIGLPNRTRSYSLDFVGGTAISTSDNINDAHSSWTETSECIDTVGNRHGDNPLMIVKTSTNFWSLSGQHRAGKPYWSYNGYVRQGYYPVALPRTQPIPSDNMALSEGLAQSNPNRPVTDIPLFLKELIDIPRSVFTFTREMVGKYGDRPIRSGLSGVLEYEFGLGLFYKDIVRMMDFVNQTEKRLSELRAIQRNGSKGTRRARNTFSGHAYGDEFRTYVTSLYSEGNRRYFRFAQEDRQWVSTNWIPQVDLSQYNDTQLRSLANKLVGGHHIGWATFYEMMPWTWLLDWFSNIGDLVSLTRNTLPVSHTRSCVMRTTTIKIEDLGRATGSGAGMYALSIPDWGRIEKRRSPMSLAPIPEFNIPFLTGRQLSILGAIGSTKRMDRSL
nr:MAG: putative maturation protein [Leviviridae sp.]